MSISAGRYGTGRAAEADEDVPPRPGVKEERAATARPEGHNDGHAGRADPGPGRAAEAEACSPLPA